MVRALLNCRPSLLIGKSNAMVGALLVMIFGPLRDAGRGFVAYLPKGIDIFITILITYYLLRIFRFIALFGLTPQKIQRKDHLHFFNIDDIKSLAPDAVIYGYFPYMIVKKTIVRGVGALSPTFVIHIHKAK